MHTFELSIITPYGRIFNDEVRSLIAPGKKGYFGVLASHAAMFTLLKSGVLEIFTSPEAKVYYALSSGTLEVGQKGRVLILVDSAVEIQDRNINQKQLEELITR